MREPDLFEPSRSAIRWDAVEKTTRSTPSLNLTNPAAETLDFAAAAATVLSPMNSNFLALGTKDLLRSILELLPPADLARAACVCRLWREVASGREMQERAFRKPFMVRRVLGSPSSSGFWRHPDLDRFAISHRLVRGDTVPGLALKYSVQLMDIKRLNNMMSDHGIYSRQRLLIPIRDPNLLHNSTCYIELDPHAKREVAVLYLEGRPDGLFLLPRGRFTTEQGRKKILDSVKRSLQVDDETAAYYLSVSNGDPRDAILQFSEDLSWEREQQRRAHW
ncbi:F-box protein [Apostasia shenzhenica]|uniref:F-box protein n=1 Tax=Apostasia shenzhenica TaxID=1088818 RepID=A0A2I0B0S2_9ASPA|nr:F-box protein [Apostasia shenzhenica]